jgi:regulator of replication initiation timing
MSSIDGFADKRRLSKLENVELSDLVHQLTQTTSVMRTKTNLVEEENIFYRSECAKLMQRLAQMQQKAQ